MKMLQFSATHAFVNSEADLPSRLTRGKKIVPTPRKSLGKSREQMQKLLLQQK